MRISVGGILAALVIFVFGPAQAQVPPGETEYAAYKGLHLAAASGDVAEIRRLAADKKQPSRVNGHCCVPSDNGSREGATLR